MFLSVYLLLVLDKEQMITAGLKDCIPERKRKECQARSLASQINRNLESWDFSNVRFTPENKVEMIAYMVQVAVLTLVSSTIYSFGGKIYKQAVGLGIGLRASAALARIAMCDWDQIWANRQQFHGLIVKCFFRYIDDIRLLLYPIRSCWR